MIEGVEIPQVPSTRIGYLALGALGALVGVYWGWTAVDRLMRRG
jgi:hypothetical protein